jgi:hypothetical protein
MRLDIQSVHVVTDHNRLDVGLHMRAREGEFVLSFDLEQAVAAAESILAAVRYVEEHAPVVPCLPPRRP